MDILNGQISLFFHLIHNFLGFSPGLLTATERESETLVNPVLDS